MDRWVRCAKSFQTRVSKYTEKVRVLYIIRIILYFVLIQIIYAAVLCNELRCTFYEKYDLLSTFCYMVTSLT